MSELNGLPIVIRGRELLDWLTADLIQVTGPLMFSQLTPAVKEIVHSLADRILKVDYEDFVALSALYLWVTQRPSDLSVSTKHDLRGIELKRKKFPANMVVCLPKERQADVNSIREQSILR